MGAAELAAIAAALTVAVLVGQFWLLIRQNRIERVRLLADLSFRWGSLRGEWTRALLSIDPVAYGLEASAEERLRYLDIYGRYADADERGTKNVVMSKALANLGQEGRDRLENGTLLDPDFLTRLQRALDQNFEMWMPIHAETELARAELAPYVAARREVLRYLGEIAGLLLRGELGVSHAYEAFGVEVARSGRSIRQVLALEAHWLTVQPGLAARVRCLVDLMWSEGARLGELSTQPSVAEIARLKKRTGSGKRSRVRVRRLVWRLSDGTWVRRGLRVLVLNRLMKHAENPAPVVTDDVPAETLFSDQFSEERPGDNWFRMAEGAHGPRVAWLQALLNSDAGGLANDETRNAMRTLLHVQKLVQEVDP